ncbi:hypothetical protein N5E89_18075 [Comamonas aquatica]|uniref:hypothetical protein n=1 Tax=Comamonas aquatica TaxID=225991 RepID=UPI002447C3E6|nr:hypothetical protein [Comamonas aquatica]MDH1430159.1 hypothetical protein [Comamonas aquatica]
MLKFFIALSLVSVVLYLLFNARGWLRSMRRQNDTEKQPPAYFLGLLFAGLYYYGLPIWLFRYGLNATFRLLLVCVACSALLLVALRILGMVEVEDFVQSLIYGQVAAVPIRAVAGSWVARNDSRWRSAAVQRRSGHAAKAP